MFNKELIYTNCNIETKVDDQYKNYLSLFQESINYINSKEIYRQRFPDIDGYDMSYFHTITKSYNHKNPSCDCPNRLITCEHPFSYNPLIAHKNPREICPHRLFSVHCLKDFFNKELYIWRKDISQRGIKHRICCYCPKDDYMIVLEERNNGDIYFKTAYPIEFSSRRRRLLEEYNKYIKNGEKFYTETKKV